MKPSMLTVDLQIVKLLASKRHVRRSKREAFRLCELRARVLGLPKPRATPQRTNPARNAERTVCAVLGRRQYVKRKKVHRANA